MIFDDLRTEIETTGYITDIRYLASTKDWVVKPHFTVKSDKYSDVEWSFEGIDNMIHYTIEEERDDKLKTLLNDKN